VLKSNNDCMVRARTRNAVSQRLAAACTVHAVHNCFVIRARSTQRHSEVPHGLLFPVACVPFEPSSLLRILVPLPPPSATAALVAQCRRELRRRSAFAASTPSSPSITETVRRSCIPLRYPSNEYDQICISFPLRRHRNLEYPLSTMAFCSVLW
jgi:hypothetical protein